MTRSDSPNESSSGMVFLYRADRVKMNPVENHRRKPKHPASSGTVLYCIVLGGLKSTGLTKPRVVGTRKVSERNPDYPRTINAEGYLTLQIAYPKFGSALFGASPTFRPKISN